MMLPKQRLLQTIRQTRQAIEDLQKQGEASVLFFSPATAASLETTAPAEPVVSAVQADAALIKINLPRLARVSTEKVFDALAETVENCQACPLHRVRQRPVFGEGPSDARVVFIGDAPGADDDREARPLAGEAGQLFDKILASIGLNRGQVYVCNVLKCRLPGSRNPQPDELAACRTLLEQQLALLHPKLICTMGVFAAQTLLQTGEPLSALRNRPWAYQNIPVIPTFHPESLLFHPQNKRLVWEDMKRIASGLSV